ncbi:MAG TPA: cellulase family glycosylhydrolase [Phycisphaerales bacterium]|nr:cellulase family glycosylhydrolase [Phycisphaerales bacterium]HMP36392.1 cellulase family glycosylhydrolase [Phycisphaerales bacterium]
MTFISQFPWDTGYNGSITIENASTAPIENWVLVFSGGPTWSALWNGEGSVAGGVSTIVHPLWAPSIPPGGVATIGFTGVGALEANVLDCTVNGEPAIVEYVGAVEPPVTPAIAIADVSIVLVPFVDPGEDPPPPILDGFLSASASQIVDAAGNPVRITGINWFGFETGTRVVHGLWTRNWRSMLEQVRDLGFNTLRIPFSNEMLAPGATTNSINFALNPDLAGLSPIDVLDAIVAECGVLGLRVILDRHSALADNYFNEDLWYIPGSPTYTEARWIDDWTMLAARYAGDPTVIGADLFNEPKRSATWGNSSPATDWNKAAERCAEAIHAVNPDWLVIIEGVESFAGQSTWWGGNLLGAAPFPVSIARMDKLVYSAHDYPASVYAQPWFAAPDYPANLPGVWRNFWGWLFEENVAPMLIGEFGSTLGTQSDQLWLSTLMTYLDGDFDLDGMSDLVGDQRGVSWTFWCLNPNSGDTGGILNADWTTVNAAKLAYLQPSLAPFIPFEPAPPGATPQAMHFPVTLSSPAPSTISVAWNTVDGTAIAGVDYVGAAGTLHFEQGMSLRTISVTIPPHVAAMTRQFEVHLSAPVGAVIADGVAIGSIKVPCAGDLDGSGAVDGADLGTLLGEWGATGPSAAAADLDGSGTVDGADLGILLGAWGSCG